MIDIILMGIFVGSIYGMMGLGFSLIFTGIRNLLNLSYGQICILGSCLSLMFVTWLRIDPLLSLVIVLPIVFCIAYIMQYILLNRVVLKEEHGTALLTTLGLALIIENLLLLGLGPDVVTLSAYASYSLLYIELGSINLPLSYLITFFASLLACIALYVFLKYTYIGRAIRAASESYLHAQLFGVNHKKTFAITFGLAGLMAAMSGIFAGFIYPFTPTYGFYYMEMAFFVLVIGGMGSIKGSFAGGVILGIIRSLACYYVGLPYARFIGNIAILIMLYIKPQGIFGWKV
ncbi:MAG: branched-chain amino acid ABC transporter permease [Candidatus Bathyarchaeia archaeon]